MSKSDKHKITGPAASVQNLNAAGLARAINKGGDALALMQNAILDAQLHSDWRGVGAVETSLENVRHRSIARGSQNIGARAVVVSRSDKGDLARLIPDGFEYGLAWLVTLFYVRTDGDYWAGLEIGDEFHQLVTKEADLPIYWGSEALCVPAFAFGPPTRQSLTIALSNQRPDVVDDIQERGFDLYLAQEGYAKGDIGANPIPFMLWGCFVTGVSNLMELFDQSVWCPGLDADALSKRLAPLVARATEIVGGETFVHPQVLSADQAHDLSNWVAREQTIDAIINNVLDEPTDDFTARISLLVPSKPPYLDQLLIAFYNPVNMLIQTFRFARSGHELEEDVEKLAQMVRQRGVSKIEYVDPQSPRGSNEVNRIVVDGKGEWISSENAGLGDAQCLLRKLAWLPLHLGDLAPAGAYLLPTVSYVHHCGAAAAFGEHYQPEVWTAIRAALSEPGDPLELITGICRKAWAGSPEVFDWLLANDYGFLLPDRAAALAVQFKESNGSIVIATDNLLTLLEQTDIGEDCSAEFLQAGFESVYLVVKTPAVDVFFNGENHSNFIINGILAQRWVDDETNHLLLDIFLTGEPGNEYDAFPIEILPFHFRWTKGDTLANLRQQIDQDDGLGQQILDLYAGLTLYMNSKDARVVEHRDHTAAAQALGLKNRKKRRKEDYLAVNSTVDAIHIGPEESALITGTESSETPSYKGKKAHYRRGFVRMNQRFGPGRTQTRPVFIPPVLVNANKLVGSLPPKKEYKIG